MGSILEPINKQVTDAIAAVANRVKTAADEGSKDTPELATAFAKLIGPLVPKEVTTQSVTLLGTGPLPQLVSDSLAKQHPRLAERIARDPS